MNPDTSTPVRPRDGQEETYRYERKFVLDAASLADFRLRLKLHPELFREAYPARHVNNVYFDTPDFTSLFDNIEGVKHRMKMRVRWYGQLYGEVPNPLLEFKIKQGLVGTKRRFDLPPFTSSKEQLSPAISESIATADLPPAIAMQLTAVAPVLLNRYRREYYHSSRGFRLTIDSVLQSYDPTPTVHAARTHPEIVIELKYDRDLEPQATELLSHFGMRVMKNSKYVAGLGGDGH